MASYNKVMLLGNLTRDPQLSYLPSQTAVVEIGIATNRKFKKNDGSQGEEVCFVDCIMFGKRAEVINKYLGKGDPLFLEGRLKFESWQGQDGKKHSKLKVLIENFEFVGGRQNDNSQQSNGETFPGDEKKDENDVDSLTDDDIPF